MNNEEDAITKKYIATFIEKLYKYSDVDFYELKIYENRKNSDDIKKLSYIQNYSISINLLIEKNKEDIKEEDIKEEIDKVRLIIIFLKIQLYYYEKNFFKETAKTLKLFDNKNVYNNCFEKSEYFLFKIYMHKIQERKYLYDYNVDFKSDKINAFVSKYFSYFFFVFIENMIDKYEKEIKKEIEIHNNSLQEHKGGKFKKKSQKKKTFKKPVISQNKENKYKEVLGKRMKIYKKPDSRKEFVRYKGELVPLVEYKKTMKEIVRAKNKKH